jgi:GAF domain-containing protein
MKADPPANEVERARSLALYDILDTLPERVFDEITLLASYICGCPIATISIIDKDRQWYKSRVGMNASETSRDISFCAHTIRQNEPLIVEDASTDPRFMDNPVVVNEPHVRFYAGVSLVNPEGFALGTLCVVDVQPRQLGEEQIVALDALSKHVMTHLELRRSEIDRKRAQDEIQRLNAQLQRAAEHINELQSTHDSLRAEMEKAKRHP